MDEHIAIKQHLHFGYWFIAYWDPKLESYTQDTELCKIISWDKAQYHAKMCREYNGIIQIADVYFPNPNDAKKAKEWVDAMFLAVRMRRSE